MEPGGGPAYRIPPADLVASLAQRELRAARKEAPTQAMIHRSVEARLREEDPAFRLGPARLRSILLRSPRVSVRIQYAQRPSRRPLQWCPVCGEEIRPLRNRTLEGDTVILGWRCTRCPFWTPVRRRVPARYAFRWVGR